MSASAPRLHRDGSTHCCVPRAALAIGWEGGKKEGQIPILGVGAGHRISCSVSSPAGPRNVGLEIVTLDSGPSHNSSLLGELIPGEQPLSPHTTVS